MSKPEPINSDGLCVYCSNWVSKDGHYEGCEYRALTQCAARMAEQLAAMINHVEELGCTCIDRSEGHQKDCSGTHYASDARAALQAWKELEEK